MPTTAAQAAVTTGTAIKTMLQIATPSTKDITIIAWGFTTGEDETGIVELLQTDVAATVTAHVAAGVQPQHAGSPASLMTLGTTATGYTATAEGSITATRVFDAVAVASVTATEGVTYSYQFMPDERPVIPVSRFLRVRATFGTAVNLRTWIVWDE
jgi:hypothetical protein